MVWKRLIWAASRKIGRLCLSFFHGWRMAEQVPKSNLTFSLLAGSEVRAEITINCQWYIIYTQLVRLNVHIDTHTDIDTTSTFICKHMPIFPVPISTFPGFSSCTIGIPMAFTQVKGPKCPVQRQKTRGSQHPVGLCLGPGWDVITRVQPISQGDLLRNT